MSRDGIVSSQVKKLSNTKLALIKEQKEYMKYHEHMEQSNEALLTSNKKLFESLKQRYDDFIALMKKLNDINISLNQLTTTYQSKIETEQMMSQLIDLNTNSKDSNSKIVSNQQAMLLNTIELTKKEVRELHSRLKLVEQQSKYEESFCEENAELEIRKNELEKKVQITQKEIMFLQNQFRDIYPYDTYPELAILFKKMNNAIDGCFSLRKDKLDLIQFNNKIQSNHSLYEKKKKLKPEVVFGAFEFELNSDTSADSISGVCGSSEDLSPKKRKSKRKKADFRSYSTLTEVKPTTLFENPISEQESFLKDKNKENQSKSSLAIDKKRQKLIQQISMNQPISTTKKHKDTNENDKKTESANHKQTNIDSIGYLSGPTEISEAENKSSQVAASNKDSKSSSHAEIKSDITDKSLSQNVVVNSPDLKKHKPTSMNSDQPYNNSILANSTIEQNEDVQLFPENKEPSITRYHSQNINTLTHSQKRNRTPNQLIRNHSFSTLHVPKSEYHLHNSIHFPRGTTVSDADQDSIMIQSNDTNGKHTQSFHFEQYDTYTQTDESLRSLRAAFLNEELHRFQTENELNDSIHRATLDIDEMEMDIIDLQREKDLRKRRIRDRLRRLKLVTSTTFDFDSNARKSRTSVDIQTDSVPLISNLRDEIINNTQSNPKDLLIRQEENDLVALLSQRNLELEIIKMANVRKQLDLDSLLKRLKIVDPLLYSAETHEPAPIAVDPEILEKRQSKQDKLDSLEAHIEEAFNETEVLSSQISDQQFLVDSLTRELTNMAYEPRSDVPHLCRSLKKDRTVITEQMRQLKFVHLEEESIDKSIYHYSEQLSKDHLFQMTQRVDNLYSYLNKLKARFNNQRAIKERRTLTLTSEDELNSIQRRINDVISEIDVYRMRTNGIISKIEKQTRVILAKNIRYPEPMSSFKRHQKSRSLTTKI